DIKPLLKSRCYACHGALKQEAGLRLDTGSLIRSGGDSGPALQPGQPAASLLVHKITATDPAIRMPPEGEPLSPAQISLLQNWIADGGLSPDNEQPESDPRSHWAFQPITRPPVPAISSSAPHQTI
ncbi:MAG: c-type cytochrome domain-containing protein, partial [Planctomyces sp.]